MKMVTSYCVATIRRIGLGATTIVLVPSVSLRLLGFEGAADESVGLAVFCSAEDFYDPGVSGYLTSQVNDL